MNGRRGDDQQRGREVRPDQQRHPPEGHSGRTHGDDRDQEVERGRDRGGAGELHAEVEERLPQRRPGGERRVAGPAGVEGAARGEEAADEEQPGERQHPEAERVEAREGHVRGADHQRQDVVGDAGEDRDHEDEDHQHRVGGEEAVVGRRVDDLGARLGELGADQHRHQAAHEEEEEGGADVLDADHLVIGVEVEVVLPALGAVLGVVVGDRRHAGRPAQPVVEAAEAGEEAERRR